MTVRVNGNIIAGRRRRPSLHLRVDTGNESYQYRALAGDVIRAVIGNGSGFRRALVAGDTVQADSGRGSNHRPALAGDIGGRRPPDQRQIVVVFPTISNIAARTAAMAQWRRQDQCNSEVIDTPAAAAVGTNWGPHFHAGRLVVTVTTETIGEVLTADTTTVQAAGTAPIEPART